MINQLYIGNINDISNKYILKTNEYIKITSGIDNYIIYRNFIDNYHEEKYSFNQSSLSTKIIDNFYGAYINGDKSYYDHSDNLQRITQLRNDISRIYLADTMYNDINIDISGRVSESDLNIYVSNTDTNTTGSWRQFAEYRKLNYTYMSGIDLYDHSFIMFQSWTDKTLDTDDLFGNNSNYIKFKNKKESYLTFKNRIDISFAISQNNSDWIPVMDDFSLNFFNTKYVKAYKWNNDENIDIGTISPSFTFKNIQGRFIEFNNYLEIDTDLIGSIEEGTIDDKYNYINNIEYTIDTDNKYINIDKNIDTIDGYEIDNINLKITDIDYFKAVTQDRNYTFMDLNSTISYDHMFFKKWDNSYIQITDIFKDNYTFTLPENYEFGDINRIIFLNIQMLY